VRHNYPLDLLMFKYGTLVDEMEFSRGPAPDDTAPLALQRSI